MYRYINRSIREHLKGEALLKGWSTVANLIAKGPTIVKHVSV